MININSNGVYTIASEISTIGMAEIEFLKSKLSNQINGRVRINLHQNSSDLLHEMFIAIKFDSYIRPHKHQNKSEAFHLVYGEIDIIIFNENGDIIKIIPLSANNNQKPFYYRLSAPLFHTIIVHSDIAIIHEITNGPFFKQDTILATFAPEETDDFIKIQNWKNELTTTIGNYNE